MKYLTTVFLITISCLVLVVNVQAQDNNKGFKVPSEYVSMLFASDSHCPLQISEISEVIGYSNGGFYFGYKLQNVSNTNVESYLIEELNWFGNRGYSHPAQVNKNMVFAPLTTYDTLSGKNIGDLISFDKNYAEQSGISSKSNKIWIAMVVKVTLSNGTVYDVSEKFALLNRFIDELELNSSMSNEELNNKEKQLREFISQLKSSNQPNK